MSRGRRRPDTLMPKASVATAPRLRGVSRDYRKTLELARNKVSAFAADVPLAVCRNADTGAVPHIDGASRKYRRPMTRNTIPALGLTLAVSLVGATPLAANATDIVVATVN